MSFIREVWKILEGERGRETGKARQPGKGCVIQPAPTVGKWASGFRKAPGNGVGHMSQ